MLCYPCSEGAGFTSLVWSWVCESGGFPSGSVVKNPPAMQEMQETQVRSLGCEDALEEGMATHSRIPWTEEPGGLQSIGLHIDGNNSSDLAHAHVCMHVSLELRGEVQLEKYIWEMWAAMQGSFVPSEDLKSWTWAVVGRSWFRLGKS